MAAVNDPEIELNQEIGRGSGTVPGAGPDAGTVSHTEGSEPPARELMQHESQHERIRAAPPESDPHGVDESVLHPRARYPLNSRRLTACHLRALAKALELPTTGSADQLRQCIEAVVERDHEYQNVLVTVKESFKVEHVVALADADGEFLVSDPVYRDARHVRVEDEAQSTAELCAVRQQLKRANHLLELANAKERGQTEQIVELQETA